MAWRALSYKPVSRLYHGDAVKALRSKGTRSKVAQTIIIPAPTAGWYVGANLADAPPKTAYVLDNAFPQLDYIRMRGGCVEFTTGMTGNVSSLMVWIGPTAQKMFAANGTGIYDVSAGGAVGASVAAITSTALEVCHFVGSAGSYLIVNNGVDAQWNYSGAAWSQVPAITGLPSPFAQTWVFKSRLYGVTLNSLKSWYLPLDSIGGAATSFDLTDIFTHGGYLVCGATWAISSNSGLYQVNVFITSEGEVAVYDGAYPGDPAWTLKGLYKIGKPLGRRCIMKAGGDLAVMTESGIIPMSSAMTLDEIALQNKAVTAPIAPEWRNAVIARAGLTGWQIVTWPLQSMAIVNLPKLSSSDFTQYVANAQTGAWCRYIGYDANCFAVFNNNLYFGTSDGRVMQAETGGIDDTRYINTTIFPSYSALIGGDGGRKQVRMVKPFIRADFIANYQIRIEVDYDTTIPAQPAPSSISSTSPKWDISLWDIATWGVPLTDQSVWKSVTGYGSVISPILEISTGFTDTPDFRLSAYEVMFEAGNPFG